MIRFHQTFGAHTGRTVSFEKDIVTFGRMPDCDVSFDPQADLDASGRHAEVRREGGRWHVIDVGSRNGTWLNGQRVQRAVLSSGDEIEFGMGGPRVRVELGDAAAAQQPWQARAITGPMTPMPGPQPGWSASPASPGAMTGAATPVPAVDTTPIDASAPTIAAMATPVPGQATPPHGGPPAWTPPTSPPPAQHPPPAAPIPPTPPPGSSPKQYGERTVGLMIQSALAEAQRAQPASKSTAEIHAIAVDAAHRSSRGLKIVVAMLAFLLVAAIGVIGVLIVRSRIEEPTIEPVAGEVGPRIAAELGPSVYVLVEQRGDVERGLCSAFAVRPDLLATNAHCIHAMQRGKAEGATHVAVPNGGAGARIAVGQMWHHPEFVAETAAPSADVGIVQIAGTASKVAEIASMQELRGLSQGSELYVLGFPGDLATVGAPVAIITRGVVASLTAFDGSAAPFETARLIQHDAATSPGTSGSPIFDRAGKVVGINAGTFRAATRQDVFGDGGPAAQTVMMDSSQKYGIRADVLASLLAGMGR